jgi:hypothetical protein
MKSQNAIKPRLEVVIARDQDGEPLVGRAPRQPEAMIALGIANHNMTAVLGLPIGEDGRQRDRVKGASVDEARRRRDEDDGVRDYFGPPQGHLAVR